MMFGCDSTLQDIQCTTLVTLRDATAKHAYWTNCTDESVWSPCQQRRDLRPDTADARGGCRYFDARKPSPNSLTSLNQATTGQGKPSLWKMGSAVVVKTSRMSSCAPPSLFPQLPDVLGQGGSSFTCKAERERMLHMVPNTGSSLGFRSSPSVGWAVELLNNFRSAVISKAGARCFVGILSLCTSHVVAAGSDTSPNGACDSRFCPGLLMSMDALLLDLYASGSLAYRISDIDGYVTDRVARAFHNVGVMCVSAQSSRREMLRTTTPSRNRAGPMSENQKECATAAEGASKRVWTRARVATSPPLEC